MAMFDFGAQMVTGQPLEHFAADFEPAASETLPLNDTGLGGVGNGYKYFHSFSTTRLDSNGGFARHGGQYPPTGGLKFVHSRPAASQVIGLDGGFVHWKTASNQENICMLFAEEANFNNDNGDGYKVFLCRQPNGDYYEITGAMWVDSGKGMLQNALTGPAETSVTYSDYDVIRPLQTNHPTQGFIYVRTDSQMWRRLEYTNFDYATLTFTIPPTDFTTYPASIGNWLATHKVWSRGQLRKKIAADGDSGPTFVANTVFGGPFTLEPAGPFERWGMHINLTGAVNALGVPPGEIWISRNGTLIEGWPAPISSGTGQPLPLGQTGFRCDSNTLIGSAGHGTPSDTGLYAISDDINDTLGPGPYIANTQKPLRRWGGGSMVQRINTLDY